MHTFSKSNMENDHDPIPGIDWDAVFLEEAAAADEANLNPGGEADEIVEELVLDDNGDPVGAFGLGLGHGQNGNGHHDEQPPEEALEIVAEELEQGEQNLEALEDFEALAIVPPPAGGLIPPLRRRDNLKHTREDVYDLTLDHRPMRLKKPKKPTQ